VGTVTRGFGGGLRRGVCCALIAVVLVAGCTSQVQAPASTAVVATAAVQAPATIEPTIRPMTARSASSARPTLAQAVGQKLVVRMEGVTPSADLIGRIGRGEVGGVILLGANITTRSALIALTGQLRAAAKAGGQPTLLIAVDQEGGSIKRIPWAPPTVAPPQMGRLSSTAVARAQGASTGAALHGLGIDVDFAPVADVPATTASFMYRMGRTFSFSAVRTARLADAFASGLESRGVVPSMKHFPGIGFATRNTDAFVVGIGLSKARLAPGLRPYRMAIAHHIPLIMLSNATYPVYDGRNAAGWSHAISVTLLRHDLGFTGVTITDSLDGTARARAVSVVALAIRAALAGTDMILTTGTERSTRAVYATLLAAATNGTIPAASLQASYDRILALKASL